MASKMDERAELRGQLKDLEWKRRSCVSKRIPTADGLDARIDGIRGRIAQLTEEIAAETPQPRRRRHV